MSGGNRAMRRSTPGTCGACSVSLTEALKGNLIELPPRRPPKEHAAVRVAYPDLGLGDLYVKDHRKRMILSSVIFRMSD
jgi:hypothetical protein